MSNTPIKINFFATKQNSKEFKVQVNERQDANGFDLKQAIT